MKPDQPWYILGAGAIGCLWAAAWRQSGTDVVLIVPTPRTSSTLQFTDQHGTQSLTIKWITLNELTNSQTCIRKLLITTKAQDTLAALSAIKNNLGDDAIIIILQNGMAAKSIPALLPGQTLLMGITTDGAYRTEPLAVTHAGRGTTFIGSYDASETIYDVIKQLPHQLLDIQIDLNIEQRQWQKLAVNAVINALTAIYHCRNGQLLKSPQAVARMQRICQEIMSLTQAGGLPQQWFTDLFQQVEKTLQITAENYSSMYQDIAHGKPTEIDFINGYLCREAEKLAIACPENQQLLNEIKSLEQHSTP